MTVCILPGYQPLVIANMNTGKAVCAQWRRPKYVVNDHWDLQKKRPRLPTGRVNTKSLRHSLTILKNMMLQRALK